jgi:hypothetical protein
MSQTVPRAHEVAELQGGDLAPANHEQSKALGKAGETAEVFPIEGATHVGLYDHDEYVSQAVPS